MALPARPPPISTRHEDKRRDFSRHADLLLVTKSVMSCTSHVCHSLLLDDDVECSASAFLFFSGTSYGTYLIIAVLFLDPPELSRNNANEPLQIASIRGGASRRSIFSTRPAVSDALNNILLLISPHCVCIDHNIGAVVFKLGRSCNYATAAAATRREVIRELHHSERRWYLRWGRCANEKIHTTT